MPHLVYKISNTINDKIYIGQTCRNINQRFSEHKSIRKTEKPHCVKLVNAFHKYGKNNFVIDLIVSCEDQSTADFLERFWITTYDSIENGYNIVEGGSVHKQSEETKKKIGLASKGRNVGRKHSDETKALYSIQRKGKKHSKEWSENIGKGKLTGRHWTLVDGKRVWSKNG